MNSSRYNVECLDCGQVFSPVQQSPLWWRVHQRATKGYFDCLRVSGEKCGCVREQTQPDSPFRVFGYDDMCRDFSRGFTSFTEAVKEFRELHKEGMYVVFISGVSKAVQSRLARL